ncbi:MAG: hypothetical protein E4H14_16040 [Candidatus Thorarchaeota archaeon]|nr:MAG: hypothetical protein E4H14_16040 [Candidatus Thorarchaeota archaeon]
MIASERTQNMIVVIVIMVAIISSGLLVSNATYYGGSYSLAGRLEVNLIEVKVTNINHTEGSSDPSISLTFNLHTSSLYEGNVRITFMGATITLNEDLLSYTPVAYTPPVSEQYLHPEFNETYTLSNTATTYDREAILDADTSSTWNWEIRYRYSFIVFDQAGTIIFRYLDFNTTITTFV